MSPTTNGQESSRFLKYLGFDAHQKSASSKRRSQSPTASRASTIRSRSSSSASVAPRKSSTTLRDLFSSSEKLPPVPRITEGVALQRTSTLESVNSHTSRSRSTSTTSTAPETDATSTYDSYDSHSFQGSVSPPPTSPSGWHRKMSLPHFPLWSPSSPISDSNSFDTPPLSPTNELDEVFDFYSPPTPNTRRPSFRSLAGFAKKDASAIEPLQYVSPLHYASDASSEAMMRRPSLPLMLPELDFQSRRMERSVSHGTGRNGLLPSGAPWFPPYTSRHEVGAYSYDQDVTRMSTFQDLGEFLINDNEEDKSPKSSIVSHSVDDFGRFARTEGLVNRRNASTPTLVLSKEEDALVR